MESKKLDMVLDGLGVIIINVIMVMLLTGITARFLKIYIPFTGELPPNLMTIMVFLLVGILWKRGNIITLDSIFLLIPKKVQKGLQILFDISGVVLAGFWLYGSIKTVMFDRKFTQLTTELFINWEWYHIPFTIAMAIFALYVILHAIKIFRPQVKES